MESLKFYFPENELVKPNGKRRKALIHICVIYIIIFSLIGVLAIVENQNLNILRIPIFCSIFCLIGWSQFALSNALHEALHDNVGNHQNDLATSILVAFPLGFSFKYRATHFAHHRHVGDPDKDPDYNAYTNFPKSKYEFIKRLLKNISGLTAIVQFIQESQLNNVNKSKKLNAPKKFNYDFILLCLVQVIIFLFFAAMVGWWGYIFFWVLPLITIGKLLSSMRLLCEHGTPDPNRVFVIRNIIGGFFQSKFLGMFGFDYHADHHLYPTVPFGMLPKLNTKINASGDVPENKNYETFYGGHFRLLKHWFNNLPLYTNKINVDKIKTDKC